MKIIQGHGKPTYCLSFSRCMSCLEYPNLNYVGMEYNSLKNIRLFDDTVISAH